MPLGYSEYTKQEFNRGIDTVQKLTDAVSVSRGGQWNQYYYGRGISPSTIVVYNDKDGRSILLKINNVSTNVIDEIRMANRWIG